jgi:hypothetical protein
MTSRPSEALPIVERLRDEPQFDGADEDFDCLMTPSGWCEAAGSESCEFECPLRQMQRVFPSDPARPA